MATIPISIGFSGSAVATPSTVGSRRLTHHTTATGTLNFDQTKFHFIRNLVLHYKGTGELSYDTSHLVIERGQVWWNKNYTYRRILRVEPSPAGFEVGHPLYANVSKDVVRQNKARLDGADFEVLRLVSHFPETWELLPKRVQSLDTTFKFTWDTRATIPPDTAVEDTYYIYYGNAELKNAPDSHIHYLQHPWFLQLSPSADVLDYTRPGEHWAEGKATEYQAKMTFKFYGERVRILATLGIDQGIAEVQIDNGQWHPIDLFANVSINEVVYTRNNLPLGTHTLRYRVSGTKNPSSIGYGINFTRIDYLKHGLVTNVAEEADETLMWSSAIGGVIGG